MIELENENKNIVSFSGGKDSLALILWAKENLDDFDVIFCDTNWEHAITYSYIDYIDQTLLNGKLIRIKSDKYEGFEDMCIKRKRVPSTMARFCTQELKLFPTHKYIHEKYDGKVELYLGIRKEESTSRAKMQKRNFDFDYYGCWINRPLIDWSSNDVFNFIQKYNIPLNPLYKIGFSRVGCTPCIMSRLSEIKLIFEKFPYIIDNIKRIENKLGRTFFSVGKIPEKYCSVETQVQVPIYAYIYDPPLMISEDELASYNKFENKKIVAYRTVVKKSPTIDDIEYYLMNHKGDDFNQENLYSKNELNNE